jgi:broad specificity phosphatase PhoE
MKASINIISILFLILSLQVLSAQNITKETTTTYYLIRHAEKDRTDKTNKDPHLTSEGKLRAKLWATYFKDKKLNAIYSTNYNRTKETAAPTANALNLKIQYYTPNNDMYSESFKQDTRGKTVLIVGHSNTTPHFTNLILEKDMFKDMADDDNSSLYIITIKEGKKQVLVKTVEYPIY